MKPTALIIRAAGTNCDRELAHAFTLAGANPQPVHVNELIRHPHLLDHADLIGFPGGFSYGDDISAGRIFANRLCHHLAEPLRTAVSRRRVPVIGICNGFQVLLKMGLLPNPHDLGLARQAATLADNAHGRFIDRWVGLHVPEQTSCIWTRGLQDLVLPIAHGEGRFVPRSEHVLHTLQTNHQIAVRYAIPPNAPGLAPPHGSAQPDHVVDDDDDHDDHDKNPNGSTDRIAGICDPSGLILA